MIKPTDEMVQLAVDKFLAAPNRNIGEIDDTMRGVLDAVLALAELDRAPACGYPLSHPSHDFKLPADEDGQFGPRQWCDGVPGDWQQPVAKDRGEVAQTEAEVWRLAHEVGAEYLEMFATTDVPQIYRDAIAGYRDYVEQVLAKGGYPVRAGQASTGTEAKPSE